MNSLPYFTKLLRAGCPLCLALTLALIPVISLQGQLASAQEDQDKNASLSPEEMPSWINPEPFRYSSRGKPDPFQPFIQRTPSSEEEDSEEVSGGPLAGIEPSQLELVGILTREGETDGSPSALVQLPNGKGFVLKEGMDIGAQGSRVTAIRKDSVVIQEEYIDVMGEKQTQDIVLKLPQSSGESNE